MSRVDIELPLEHWHEIMEVAPQGLRYEILGKLAYLARACHLREDSPTILAIPTEFAEFVHYHSYLLAA